MPVQTATLFQDQSVTPGAQVLGPFNVPNWAELVQIRVKHGNFPEKPSVRLRAQYSTDGGTTWTPPLWSTTLGYGSIESVEATTFTAIDYLPIKTHAPFSGTSGRKIRIQFEVLESCALWIQGRFADS